MRFATPRSPEIEGAISRGRTAMTAPIGGTMFFIGIGELRAAATRTLVFGILAGTLAACEAGEDQPANEERAMASSDTTQVAPPNLGKWQVIKKTDPLSDEVNVSIVLAAPDSGITFGVVCNERASAAGAIWEDFLGGEEIGGEKYQPVVYRVGDAEPVSDKWEVLADNQSTRIPTPREFVDKMRGANRLVLQTQPFEEMPKTAVFDTTGLTEALKANRPECDWFLNGEGKSGGAASQ